MQKARPENIQTYLEPCVTPAYSEPWYIQNPGLFKNKGICRALAYSEQRYIQIPGIL